MQSKILLLYTGGTIGMKRNYSTESLVPFDFINLRENIPELALINTKIDYQSFDEPLDSSDVNPHHWQQIAQIIHKNYHHYDGFVVLHGTDTMAFTASAISFMLQGLNKPVIFTGSQLPVGDLRTDAKENLITSLHIATLTKNNQPLIKEVCVYFEYRLFRANRTTKINAQNFDAFASPNYPSLGQSGVHLDIHETFLFQPKKEFQIEDSIDTNVGLLKLFPGMPKKMIETLFLESNLEVIILEAFGSGNVFTEQWFLNLIEKQIQEGIKIIIKTQCAGGMVELGQYKTSEALKSFGAISGKDLTTEAAIAKAIWLLPKQLAYNQFKIQYESCLVGEMIEF